MRRSRAAMGAMPGMTPISEGMSSGEGGASIVAGPMNYDQLPEAIIKKEFDWGKLPEKMARDIMAARKENISPQYRRMVEIYFRAIAEKAGKKKP